MAAYKYYACDTLTGRHITELPLKNVSYDLRINDAATFEADLVLDGLVDYHGRPINAVDLTTGGRTTVYADSGGSIQAHGTIWGRRFDDSQPYLHITALDSLSLFDHLVITTKLNYAATDQLSIARSLVNYGQSKGNSTYGVRFIGPDSCGQPRDRTYEAVDQAFVGTRIRELAEVINGFDFRFTAAWEGGQAGFPRRQMILGYPTLGRAWPASNLVFSLAADGLSLQWAEDASGSASTIYTVGGLPEAAAAGSTPPTATADAPDVRASGMPRLEDAASYNDIYQAATLQAHANGALATRKWPLQTMQLTVSLTSKSAPEPGSYLPGDQCKLWIPRGHRLYPYGAEIIAAITTVSIQPDNNRADVGLSPITITQGAYR